MSLIIILKVMAGHHHFIVNDGDIYTSPNSPTIPTLPHPRPLSVDTPDISDFQKPRWAETRHPFLAYVPLSPRYDKPPFDRLRCFGKAFPVVRSMSNWQVAPAIVTQFETLENNLLFIADTLFRVGGALVHLDFSLVSLPTQYGYKREHKHKHGAEKSALRSRDAFLPLMAWCSYNISNLNAVMDAPGNFTVVKRWEYALQQAGVNIDAIKELKESELVDFSKDYPRAGVFMDNTFWQFHNLVRSFEKDNVPVWIRWSSQYWHTMPLERLYPIPNVIQKIKAERDEASRRAAASEIPYHSSPPAGAPPTNQGFPNPEPYSGQRPGETWQAFFARRDEKNKSRLATESDRQRQQRLSREAAQQNHPLPGKGTSAPVVYHWEKDDATSHRLRIRVTRGTVPSIWNDYAMTQRIYNPHENEWDICTDLDPDAKPEDWDDDDDDFYFPHAPSPRPASPSSQQPTTPPTSSQQTSSSSQQPTTTSLLVHSLATLTPSRAPPSSVHPHSPMSQPSPAPYLTASAPSSQSVRQWHNEHAEIYNEPSAASSLVIQDDLEDKIYYRYGFVDSGLPTELQPTAKWDTVRIAFGMTGAKVPEKLRGPISLFMESLISKEREKIMPEHLWDLSSDLSPFASVANPGLRVSQVMNSDIIDSNTHYVIESRNASGNNTRWQLVVDDAATVLECFRQDRDTIRDISMALLSSGQPFSTRILREQCRQSIHRPQPHLTLGWRTPSYQPTTAEYGFYEQLRKSFFTRPHSRAAFLKGGLIWRLAIESAGILADELVLDGPSDEVLDFGTSIEPKGLWDDDLCDTDMDLICGVYKVFTGE